jgi:hypothetical protein
VKVLEGRVTFALAGCPRGRFKAQGALADSGSLVRAQGATRTLITLKGAKGTIVVAQVPRREGPPLWHVLRGAGSYTGLVGTGTVQGTASRPLLTGFVSNDG